MSLFTKMTTPLLLASLALGFAACDSDSDSGDSGVTAEQKTAVLSTYAAIASANYTDAYDDAVALKTAIDAFAAEANATTFQAAKDAWLAARESYGTTEAFRLSEGPIDAEEGWVATLYGAPEGQINAWPLDENMIDYTTAANGSTTSGNIIDTAGSFTPSGGTAVDVTTITKEALTELNENGGDANVATGYHAIEFLLWGQDQDYSSFIQDNVTQGALVAGQRPLSDFTSDTYTERRLDYLQAAADKLVDDLAVIKDAWTATDTPDCTTGVGCYRAAFLGTLSGDDAAKNIAADTALKQVMAGLGVFVKSELANERIAVAVLTPSEEDEHSCFSDNTHRDILLNFKGFTNIIKGEYEGADMGTGMYELLDADTKNAVDTLIATIQTKVDSVDSIAKTEKHFDYQIQTGDPQVTVITSMKNSMRSLGDKMVDVAERFGISLTTDDVTDPDETQI